MDEQTKQKRKDIVGWVIYIAVLLAIIITFRCFLMIGRVPERRNGAAHTNHKQDGNIRTKDSYPDGTNCMRICLREAIGIGDNTYVLPHNAQ